MQMNLFMLLFLSLPEAIMNIIMILLIGGEKKYLDIKKRSNIIRFLSTLILVLLASLMIRPISPNVPVSMLLQGVCYVIIFGMIYNLEVYRCVFSVSLLVLYFATIENIFIPYIIVYISKGIDNFYSNNINLLVISLAFRLIQLCIIKYLWRYYVVFLTFKAEKGLYVLLTVVIFGISFADYIVSFVYAVYFNSMELTYKLAFGLGLLLFIICNFLILKLIFSTIKWAIEGGSRQYQNLKDNSDWYFEKVSNLLDNNEFDEAKKLLERIKNKKY